MTSPLEYFQPGTYDHETDPEEYGYEPLDVERPTGDGLIVAYMQYIETGGPPVRVWERRLRKLEREGRLDEMKRAGAASRPH